MHEHNECEHEIKYCKVCDICYCEKCKKEWYKGYYTFTQPYITYGDSTVEFLPTDRIQNHVHGKELE